MFVVGCVQFGGCYFWCLVLEGQWQGCVEKGEVGGKVQIVWLLVDGGSEFQLLSCKIVDGYNGNVNCQIGQVGFYLEIGEVIEQYVGIFEGFLFIDWFFE